MPIRIEDPFHDPTQNLNTDVNPFLSKMREGMENGSLPVLYGPRLKPLQGAWRSEFANTMAKPPEDLVLEVGSHKGEVLKKMAANHPDTGFVGVDITFKRVVTLAEKAQTLGLHNLRSLLCNGRALEQVFEESELSGALIFFPDPWAKKKRQQKNRLINHEFLLGLKKILKPGAFLWFKTDHKPYFDQVLPIAADLFAIEPAPQGIPSEIYTSRFERHFTEQGLPTYEICWRNSK
ncbi:tRNA (guanine(46)-N(7))-methyltransferase TrmB [Pseudobacteriovorax antillogorgiicola]|uniref:tRNA (guanine-N(7)-)-methyltransferase n=1 Tax=Pseudobacteriovorax antillogorgiicola TaxID=1513793 RepID=A0A1Y6C0M3_9BACT|nr:hypothetical protein [Pseudobacteriovorax antillogorgiicola]TCS52358.1 tRNA (guanine-N(7)-)-methyltransferase [Pseudobacteriovorax antillogorgiicola]SMF29477.1 tRNA (guanine-N(7)-)-methyltransferase [Pseudobacteriovorax antillogorgiicola]